MRKVDSTQGVDSCRQLSTSPTRQATHKASNRVCGRSYHIQLAVAAQRHMHTSSVAGGKRCRRRWHQRCRHGCMATRHEAERWLQQRAQRAWRELEDVCTVNGAAWCNKHAQQCRKARYKAARTAAGHAGGKLVTDTRSGHLAACFVAVLTTQHTAVGMIAV